MRHKYLLSRRFHFDAGHRVLGHEGKCANLHGHRYVAEIQIIQSDLDSIGRVIDFGALKSMIGEWIDEKWDHNVLLHKDDPLLEAQRRAEYHADPDLLGPKPPYIMKYGNPTAENIARELHGVVVNMLPDRWEASVKIEETPNCHVTFSGADIYADQ